MIKKRHYKDYFIAINTKDFSIRTSSNTSTMAQITKISRNTIAKIVDRVCLKGFIVIKVREE